MANCTCLTKDQVAEVVARKSRSCRRLRPLPQRLRNLVAYLSRLRTDPNANAGLSTGELGAGVPFADVAHPEARLLAHLHGNVSGNRFSPLDQINTANVARLAPQWMFPIPGAARARWRSRRWWWTA